METYRERLASVFDLEARYPPGAGEATRRAIDEGRYGQEGSQEQPRRSWRDTAPRNAAGQFVNAAGQPLSEATIRSRDNRDDPTHPAAIRAARRAAQAQEALNAVAAEAPTSDRNLGAQELQIKTDRNASEMLKAIGFKNSRDVARSMMTGVAFENGEVAVKSGPYGNELQISGAARNADGSMRFKVQMNGETAYVGLVESSGGYRQSGDTMKLLSNLATFGEKMGLKSVDTTANLDMGGFAWARMGFEASNPSTFAETVSKRLDRLEQSVGRTGTEPSTAGSLYESYRGVIKDAEEASKSWSSADFANIRQVLKEHAGNPKLPGIVSELKVGGQKVGRHLLRGTNWSARLNLKDEAAMARFKRFAK